MCQPSCYKTLPRGAAIPRAVRGGGPKKTCLCVAEPKTQVAKAGPSSLACAAMGDEKPAASATVSEQEVSEFREIFNLVDRVSECRE